MTEGKLADPIGLPLDRVDGHLKVTGRATYAFEYATQGGAAYGVIVPAAIAKGRVVAVDVRDAERAPGVLLVLTKDNAPPQSPWGPVDLPDRFARAEPALDTDEVRYFGFPVAFVVAETFEQATAAAALVRVRYESLPGQFDLRAAGPRAEDPGHLSDGAPADSAIGDFEAAFAAAPVKIEAIYTTPYQNQAPMEPHATMAVWDGEMLTVHTSAQLTTSPQEGLARTFNILKENVRVITRYVGGGFGSKLPFYVDATLAAIGARILHRPVKLAMTRPQLFHMTTHRTASEQRLRLGADRDGRLTAYGQDALVQSARFDNYAEPVCGAARMLYAAPNRLTRHRLAKLDLPRSDSMRAPGDAIGLLALECAMDELADALGLDPVDLRLRNDTEIDPERDRPFASRHLAEALRQGAARFGWDKRVAKPASVTRWALAHRSRCRLCDPRRRAAERERACAPRERRPADRGAGDDRYRHRHLHDPHAGCRRGDGVAGRPCHGSPWRHPFSTDRRLGRLLWIGDVRCRGSCRLSETQGRPRPGDHGSRGIGHPRRTRQHLRACRLRRAFRGSRGASGHRRGACSTHARRIRGRSYPQREDGALADDRRHDMGHRIGADRGEPRRPALRVVHQPGSGELSCRSERRRRRFGRRVSGRGRSARQSARQQGHRRAWNLRRGRRRHQCHP